MYLYCNSCGWEQDDFYSSEGYNPANYLKDWMKQLCSNDVDKQFTDDAEFVRENGPISTREVIARELEKFAQRIREMKWITWEHWKKERDTAVCPKCGRRDFSID